MLPTPNYKWPNLVNVGGRGLSSLTRPAWNRRILPGNRLLYRNPYQASNNKQLAYINQNVWSQKRSRPNVWNYLPFGDVPVSLYYNPSVAQVHSWRANARARPILQGVVGFRSRIDEDPILVEKRIKEYYDQRLNKNRNKWLFNRVQGTTPHLQEIFIGRCWDFVTNKGKHLQNPSKVDCQELWKTFLTSFAFKGPCSPTLQDYAPFFNMYEEKPLKDRVFDFRVIESHVGISL